MIHIQLPSGAALDRPTVGSRLDELRPGDTAVVLSVGGDVDLRRRLLEMGFVSGTSVRIVRLAPFGDPMEVQLHGYHLSLRRSEAETVLVERP